MSLLAELKRRNVVRIGLAWLALGWLLIAMANLLFPALNLPLSSVRWLMGFLLLAWPLVMAWCWWHGKAVARAPDAARTAFERRIDQASVVLVIAALSLSLLHQFLAPYARERTAAEVAASPEVAAAVAAADKATAEAQAAIAATTARGPVDPHSIAVLPFANLSPAKDDAYFADGLAEELLNVLAKVEGLKVISRSSSFQFRDKNQDARAIGERLGVAHLVEGSVRRQGDQVRIAAQLVDAASGRQLWSQTYDRQLSDIFLVQEEISQAIADALAESLGVRKVQVAASTADLTAYEQYLRGRQLFVQRGANLPAARNLLEQAVARDPDFADAWAALAGTWYVWRSYAPAQAGVDTLDQAAQAADRALALDPEHAAALAVSARLAADHGDHLREAELIAKALAREPNNANTWLWKGLGQYEAGHLVAAHASFVQAQRLDPLSGLQLGWLAITMPGGEGDANVDAMLHRAHELGWRGPASRALFLRALSAGREPAEDYLAWLHDDDAMPAKQREMMRPLAGAFTDPEQRAEAQQVLRAAVAANPEWDWALLLQVHGLTDEAMEAALGAGNDAQTMQLTMWSPALASFRAHPRFHELAQRKGLVAYWREFGPPDGETGSGSLSPLASASPRGGAGESEPDPVSARDRERD